ncbi:hypothetical protein IT398_02280 [Candidatus Nomurabacteria bacterium]|nr:hypothetical protein [Candidatus Nomurabacteria bacterium]
MAKFIDWLRNEVEVIKMAEVKSVDEEVGEGEEVIGVLTDPYLQKLAVLRGRLTNQMVKLSKEHAHKQIESFGAEFESGHDSATCEDCKMSRALATLGDKKKTVDLLFWTGLRHELSEEAHVKLQEAGGVIGLRKDWKIVACRKSGPASMGDLLSSIGLPFAI